MDKWVIDDQRELIEFQQEEIKSLKHRLNLAERGVNWLERGIQMERHFLSLLDERDLTIRLLKARLVTGE